MWSSLLSTGAHIYLSRHAGHLQKGKKNINIDVPDKCFLFDIPRRK